MKYVKMQKESLTSCPTFRSSCLKEKCDAYQIHTIKVKDSEEPESNPKEFCEFFKLYIEEKS